MSLTEKRCGSCRTTKPITEFWKNRSHPSGYKYECKDCARGYSKDWEHNNRDRRRAYHRSRKVEAYGITTQEYSALLKAQGGVCAFCGQPDKTGRQLAIDHDHDTGVIRGLLCSGCNAARVSNHTLAYALKLLEYLTNPPAVDVIGERVAPIHQPDLTQNQDGGEA